LRSTANAIQFQPRYFEQRFKALNRSKQTRREVAPFPRLHERTGSIDEEMVLIPFNWPIGDDDRIAIIDQAESVTYGTLKERIARTSAALLARCSDTEEPVIAIILPAGLDFIVAFLAAMESGALVVPIDHALPVERIAEVLQDAGVSFVIGCDDICLQLRQRKVHWEWISLSELGSENPYEGTVASLAWKGLILYTSGSTGNPKGVLLAGSMLIREATTLIERLGIVRDDRISHVLSPSVIGGLREIFSALLSGATLVPLRVRELGIGGLIEQLTAHQVTICRLVSTLFRSICHGLPPNHQWAVRRMYIGGEPLFATDVALFRKHFSSACQLHNVFGATEFGLCTHFSIPPDFDISSSESIPIGYANPGYSLSIVDNDGREVRNGEMGCLVVAGECIAEGYRSTASNRSTLFPADSAKPGWRIFETADLVRANRSGYLEYCGRLDTQRKIHGNRVELAGIENCLLSAECVLDAAVVDLIFNGRNQLYAVVERRPETTIDLRQWCIDRLPAAAVPHEIIELPSLPKSIQGKCDRTQVKHFVEQHLQRLAQSTAESVVPSTRREILERLWREATQLSQSSPIDPSAKFTADSIASLEFLLDVRRDLQAEVTPAELHTAGSLERLFAMIESKKDLLASQGTSSCLRLSKPFPGPSLFLMHGATGDCSVYSHIIDAWNVPVSVYGVMADTQVLKSQKSLNFSVITQYALASIRSHQASGPYLLAGYYYGGILSFEVARELLRQGEEVAFCGVIDSFLPLPVRYPTSVQNFAPAILNGPAWLVDAIASGELRDSARRFFAMRDDVTVRLGTFTENAMSRKNLSHALLSACDHHTLGSWSKSLWMYRARVRPLLHSHGIERSWSSATGAKIISRVLPGNHSTIMAPPHATALARALSDDVLSVLARTPSAQSR